MASLLGQDCKRLRFVTKLFYFHDFLTRLLLYHFSGGNFASSKLEFFFEYLSFCVLWRLFEGLSNNNRRQEREGINTKIQREQISGGKKKGADLEHLISVVKQSTSYLVHPGHRALFWPFCALCKKRGSAQSVTGAPGNDIQGASHKGIAHRLSSSAGQIGYP